MKTKEVTFEMFVKSKVLMTKAAYEHAYGVTDICGINICVYLNNYFISDLCDGTYHVNYDITDFTGTLQQCELMLWENFARQEVNSPSVYLDKRIEEAARDGEDGFWDRVVKHFPECKVGDFSSDQWIILNEALKTAISQWYNKNKS